MKADKTTWLLLIALGLLLLWEWQKKNGKPSAALAGAPGVPGTPGTQGSVGKPGSILSQLLNPPKQSSGGLSAGGGGSSSAGGSAGKPSAGTPVTKLPPINTSRWPTPVSTLPTYGGYLPTTALPSYSPGSGLDYNPASEPQPITITSDLLDSTFVQATTSATATILDPYTGETLDTTGGAYGFLPEQQVPDYIGPGLDYYGNTWQSDQGSVDQTYASPVDDGYGYGNSSDYADYGMNDYEDGGFVGA